MPHNTTRSGNKPRIVSVIEEEITDLKELIGPGDKLVDRHPLDLGLVISQTQLYDRLERLKEELRIAKR